MPHMMGESIGYSLRSRNGQLGGSVHEEYANEMLVTFWDSGLRNI